MRRRWIHFIAVLFFFVGENHLGAEAVEFRARIVRVNRVATAVDPPELSHLQMPKFLVIDTPESGDEYQVTWEPGADKALAEAVVSFEYAQEQADGLKSLSIRYPFAVTSRRVATFTIADRAYRLGGPVTRWRVRVRQGEKILAEKASPTWKASP